jgi:predicted acyl esterase
MRSLLAVALSVALAGAGRAGSPPEMPPPSLVTFRDWIRAESARRSLALSRFAPSRFRDADAASARTVTMVPARDGARLRTVLCLPRDLGGGRAPALVLRTPYLEPGAAGADPAVFSGMAEYFCRRGYAIVFQSVRGKYGSEGRYELFARHEIDDAAALLDWVAAQPWCSGRVAVHGVSHDGFDALAAACTNHPSLALVIAGGAPAALWSDAFLKDGLIITSTLDYLRYQEVQDGAPFTPGFREAYLARTLGHADPASHDNLMYGRELSLWDGLLAAFADPRAPYWKDRQILDELSGSRVPIVHVAGWHDDGDMPDVFRNYVHLARRRDGPQQRLIVGWWGHGGSGPYLDPETSMAPYLRERYDAYLAHFLRGEASALLHEPPVQIYAQGRDEWLGSDRWPLREVTARTFHLDPGGHEGRLQAAVPAAPASSSWRSDPTTASADGLAFFSEPLAADLQLMGTVKVSLTLSTDARDMDVFAVMFRPDAGGAGTGLNLFGGLRGRFRDGPHAAPRPLTPGERFTVRLTFGPLGHRLKAGERIGLWIAASLPGTGVLNDHTGGPIAGATGLATGTHTLHAGPDIAGSLELTVLPQ